MNYARGAAFVREELHELHHVIRGPGRYSHRDCGSLGTVARLAPSRSLEPPDPGIRGPEGWVGGWGGRAGGGGQAPAGGLATKQSCGPAQPEAASQAALLRPHSETHQHGVRARAARQETD